MEAQALASNILNCILNVLDEYRNKPFENAFEIIGNAINTFVLTQYLIFKTQFTLETFIMLDDKQYTRLLINYLNSTKKERKNWKQKLTDHNGQATSVRFYNTELQNWSLRHHKWCKIIPQSFLTNMKKCIEENNDNLSLSWTGTSDIDKYLQGGCSLGQAVQLAANDNHTGNHYRNQPVRIPKSSDGICRA